MLLNATHLKHRRCNIFKLNFSTCGTGDALLQIPVFAEAINKCDRVLKPRGIDIVRIITEKDPKMFDNIVNSFVGIAAIQVKVDCRIVTLHQT